MKYKMLYEKPYKKITDEWFNTASEDEIKRFIIGYNDGQGDHGFYTYEGVLALLNECDRKNNAKPLSEMTRMEILDEFYEGLDLNGNNSDIVYFNGEDYQTVNFIS